VNSWRVTTINMLYKHCEKELNENTESLTERSMEHVDQVLCDLASCWPSQERKQALRNIVNQAVYMAKKFSLQRAQYKVEFPDIERGTVRFDPSTMEDIGADEDINLQDSRVTCVVFPAVYKLGDERGDNTHLINVITKSRVVVETG